jgi:uncharacterized protein YbjT (DUF2867 family)
MIIAVVGASGYIGQNLIKELLKQTKNTIIAISTTAEAIKIYNSRLEKHNVDVFDTLQLSNSLKQCDMAYYLIHMMGKKDPDFANAETLAAESFCKAAKKSNIKRVIYLGGLGNDNDSLSKHIISRHNTGKIIRQHFPQSIEFRASMVIGYGSVSYDIIANIVNKLPILILPKWFGTLTQPIGLNDALAYLIEALDVKINRNEIVEIGGPEYLSYTSLMKRYAAWSGKKVIFIQLPIIPFAIDTWWLSLFISKRKAKIGIAMVESLANPMLVTNKRAEQLFPAIKPKLLEEVFV